LVCCGILVCCLIAQLLHPELLSVCQRDASRIFAGEYWRIVTALFFQDGWITGGVTNILALFWIGALVEQLQDKRSWLIVSAIGALVAEAFALYWQPVGAGNSIATCSLTGFLIVARPISTVSGRSKLLRLLSAIVLVLLLAARNLHGVAGVTGAVLGALILRLRLDRARIDAP